MGYLKKKVGIIGLGDIAQKAYLPVVTAHEQIEIAGIMSRSSATVESTGTKYRIPNQFTDLTDLLRCDLDAVFVHTPTETHFSIVKECLSKGIHVYVDKPLSYDINESLQMTEYAEKQKKLLCVGFNRRFAPRYSEAKVWLEEVGGFHLCSAQKHRTKLQGHSAKHTLYDDLIHMIDLLLWLGQDEYEIRSYLQKEDQDGRLRYSSGVLTFGDASAGFSMERLAGVDMEKLELHGGGRTVEVVNMETASFYDLNQGCHTKEFGSWDSLLYRRGFTGIIDHFLQTMDKPETCTVRAGEVIQTHLLIEKLLSWR